MQNIIYTKKTQWQSNFFRLAFSIWESVRIILYLQYTYVLRIHYMRTRGPYNKSPPSIYTYASAAEYWHMPSTLEMNPSVSLSFYTPLNRNRIYIPSIEFIYSCAINAVVFVRVCGGVYILYVIRSVYKRMWEKRSSRNLRLSVDRL